MATREIRFSSTVRAATHIALPASPWQQVPADQLSPSRRRRSSPLSSTLAAWIVGGGSVVMEVQVTGNRGLSEQRPRRSLTFAIRRTPISTHHLVSRAGSYVGGGVAQMFSRQDKLDLPAAARANASLCVVKRITRGWSVSLAGAERRIARDNHHIRERSGAIRSSPRARLA